VTRSLSSVGSKVVREQFQLLTDLSQALGERLGVDAGHRFNRSSRGSVGGMTSITDAGPRELLEKANYATISTLNKNGSIHSTIVWISAEDGTVAVNSAVGRLWPTNLERDSRITAIVEETGNPYHFVEIRGTAAGSTDGADEHINALAKKYIDEDEYPYRQPGEQRIKFVIQPEHVRYVKQS
jgi:PPOX class probable F420-dependent enzyme